MAGTWRATGVQLLDLPGTYSLIARSPDEQVVVDTIAGAPGTLTDPFRGGGIDLVLVILDATSVERSLYLLAQVAETGRPVAVVITMADVAAANGNPVDAGALEHVLGVPVMAMDARKNRNIEEFTQMVRHALRTRPRVKGLRPRPSAPGYSEIAAAAAMAQEASAKTQDGMGAPGTNCEDERDLLAQTTICACGRAETEQPPAIDSTQVAHQNAAEMHAAAEDADAHGAIHLFAWVDQVLAGAGAERAALEKPSYSDKVDRILLNPLLGLPVFFAIMWVLFQLAGSWVSPIQDFFEHLFSGTDKGDVSLANALIWILGKIGLGDTWFQQFLVGGLATGLGVVASFVPLMCAIFLAISILEDSGYMARAAFLGDRLMRKIGLDGRVVLPLIMGFGCNLPSLAACRTLPSARQRLVTTLIIPYTSCAARLTVYLMLAKIFFPHYTGTVLWAMYMTSIIMVVLGAWVLKRFVTKDETAAPLMLVLPTYQMPRVVVSVKNMAMRTWAFVKGAGKIIVTMTVVVWLMSAIPLQGAHHFADADMPMEDTLYGATAMALEPAFKPAGFGDWHLTGALMTGFVAKETLVSSIVVSYNLDASAAGDAEDKGNNLGQLPKLMHESLGKSAGVGHEALAALAFMVFVLTYTPCLATVAEQARQIGRKTTTVAVLAQLAIAWILAVAVFQVGALFT